MNDYLSLVSLILFLGSVFVLSRANQWSVIASVALILGVFIVPAGLLFLSYVWPVPPIVRSVLENVVPIVAMIALFALSKAVANRVQHKS